MEAPDHAPGCDFCGIAERRPELLVTATNSWALFHVDRLFPPGSLFLALRHHTLTPDAALWVEAAPLLAEGARLLTELAAAERVYLCSFGEVVPHFHILFLSRGAGLPARHAGKRAAALIEAIAAQGVAPDLEESKAWVARYRAALRLR